MDMVDVNEEIRCHAEKWPVGEWKAGSTAEKHRGGDEEDDQNEKCFGVMVGSHWRCVWLRGNKSNEVYSDKHE